MKMPAPALREPFDMKPVSLIPRALGNMKSLKLS
jgi:hypothetical protein